MLIRYSDSESLKKDRRLTFFAGLGGNWNQLDNEIYD